MATTPNETFTIPPSPEADGSARLRLVEQSSSRVSELDPVARLTAEAIGAAAHLRTVGDPTPDMFDKPRMARDGNVIGGNVVDSVARATSEVPSHQPEVTPAQICEYIGGVGVRMAYYRREHREAA